MWKLKAYVHAPDTDVLADWYDNHTGKQWIKLWARYYTIWHHLKQQPMPGWTGAYFHLLTGKSGVGRIGFDYKRKAFRHLGFFGPNQGEFTILFPAEEQNWEYVPPGCIDIAVDRMKLAISDPSKTRDAIIKVPPENV